MTIGIVIGGYFLGLVITFIVMGFALDIIEKKFGMPRALAILPIWPVAWIVLLVIIVFTGFDVIGEMWRKL